MATESNGQTADSPRQTPLGDLLTRMSGDESETVLTGRTLKVVRPVVLVIFIAAVIVYSADLFALWDESNAIQFKGSPDQHGERTTYNYYGLTLQERALLPDSTTDVPRWYPIFVVARQAILGLVALGIGWLIFSRRPRHWMAYISTLFIVLGPLTASSEDVGRLGGGAVGTLSDLLIMIWLITVVGFLWLFPDGRFRGALIRFVGAVLGLVLALIALNYVFRWSLDEKTADVVTELLLGIGFLAVLWSVLAWAIVGIVLQIWRYRRTPLADRRLAGWNLVFLVAIPLWLGPFDTVHGFFGEADEGGDGLFGFAWQQVHETLNLAAPVLLGLWVLFLVRRQGWWDFQTLWNRTAVYGIGLVLLGGMYGGAIGVVSVIASPLAATGEQVVAVLVATAIVVFSYGPILGRVRRWVDERWFPKRAEVDALSLAFADDVRATASPAAVPDRLRAAVQTSMDPEHVELWTVGGADQR